MTLGGKKIIKLPVGYIGNGTKSDEVEIRAMTGREEDIFSDDKLPMTVRLNAIIVNCIERLGTMTDKKVIESMIPKLSVEDQTAILVALRAISVSNVYTYTDECPSCGAVIEFKLDLNTLNIQPGKAKETPVVDVTLPSGRKAKIRAMLIEDAVKVENLRLQGDETISVVIWVRLVELDGKPNPTLDDVKGLLYADRLYLREMFDTLEGGIESEFASKCQACGKIFMSYLNIARVEFLSPKMV